MTSCSRDPVYAENFEASDVTLGVLNSSSSALRYYWPSLNKSGCRVMDLGLVTCRYGIDEYETSAYAKKTSSVERRVLLTLGAPVKTAVDRLEARLAQLVKRSLTPQEICGRRIESKPLTTLERPMLPAKIESNPRGRTTRFYDRRKGVRGRLSESPPEIDYDNLVPRGASRRLEGCNVHAFVEFMVWVNHDRNNDTVTFGIKPTVFQMFVVSETGSVANAEGGLSASTPVPVSAKRLREIGVDDDDEGAPEGSDGSDDGGETDERKELDERDERDEGVDGDGSDVPPEEEDRLADRDAGRGAFDDLRFREAKRHRGP